MVAKIYRRLSPKSFALGIIVVTLILCVYYAHNTYNVGQNVGQSRTLKTEIVEEIPGVDIQSENDKELSQRSPRRRLGKCLNLIPSETDIDTVEVFRDFEFQVSFFQNAFNLTKVVIDILLLYISFINPSILKQICTNLSQKTCHRSFFPQYLNTLIDNDILNAANK